MPRPYEYDREYHGYKPPNLFVENQREASVQAPGFRHGVLNSAKSWGCRFSSPQTFQDEL